MGGSIHGQYLWSPENSYTAFPDSSYGEHWGSSVHYCMINNFMGGGWLSSSDHMVMNSPGSVASFSHDQFGVPDMIAPKLLSEWDMACSMGDCHNFSYFSYDNIDTFQGFDHQAAGTADFCNGIVPMETIITTNSYPDYHIPSDVHSHNWGIPEMIKMEEGVAAADSTRIGRYTVEERRNRILKYLKKRNQRNFNKTIKYACRKTLADKRVRIRGRFAKNNESSSSSSADDQQILVNSNIHTSYHQNINTSLFYDKSLQTIYNDAEEWFEGAAAMATYFPFTAASQFST